MLDKQDIFVKSSLDRYKNTEKDFDADTIMFYYKLGRSLASHFEEGYGF